MLIALGILDVAVMGMNPMTSALTVPHALLGSQAGRIEGPSRG